MCVFYNGATNFGDFRYSAVQIKGFGENNLVYLLDVDGMGSGAKDERRLHCMGIFSGLDGDFFMILT
jgi:hypothetical protein